MSEMNREKFEELKDAYALGALTEDEKREMELYLADHPDRRPEIEELTSISNLLAFYPAEYEPPTTLRRNIMDAVQAEAAEAGEQSPERQSALQRLRSYVGIQRLALGAAAVVLVALVSWNVALQSGNDEMQTYELQGSGAAQEVQAEVVETKEDRFVLVAENMPSMPPDQTMQIWVIQNGKPKSAGTFRPDDGLAASPVTRPIQGAEAVAVTVEPVGGSDQPTSDPVLQTKL